MRFRGEGDSFHLSGRIADNVSVVETADLIRPEITDMITSTVHTKITWYHRMKIHFKIYSIIYMKLAGLHHTEGSALQQMNTNA